MFNFKFKKDSVAYKQINWEESNSNVLTFRKMRTLPESFTLRVHLSKDRSRFLPIRMAPQCNKNCGKCDGGKRYNSWAGKRGLKTQLMANKIHVCGYDIGTESLKIVNKVEKCNVKLYTGARRNSLIKRQKSPLSCSICYETGGGAAKHVKDILMIT